MSGTRDQYESDYGDHIAIIIEHHQRKEYANMQTIEITLRLRTADDVDPDALRDDIVGLIQGNEHLTIVKPLLDVIVYPSVGGLSE